MNANMIHKGENMHATLSFAYPNDEQKLKDALAGEKYRIALERIRDRVIEMHEHEDNPEFVIIAIDTLAEFALKGEL